MRPTALASKVSAAAEDVRSYVAETAHDLTDKASEYGNAATRRTREAAESAYRSTREAADSAYKSVEGVIEAHPMSIADCRPGRRLPRRRGVSVDPLRTRDTGPDRPARRRSSVGNRRTRQIRRCRSVSPLPP